MRQQIADAHLVRDVGVGHAEPRQVIDHPIVHLQLALLGQLLQRRRGERLGVGRDRKQRVRIDLVRLADLAQAETLFHHHLAVLDDGHGDARHVEGLARAVDVGAEILQLARQGRGVLSI